MESLLFKLINIIIIITHEFILRVLKNSLSSSPSSVKIMDNTAAFPNSSEWCIKSSPVSIPSLFLHWAIDQLIKTFDFLQWVFSREFKAQFISLIKPFLVLGSHKNQIPKISNHLCFVTIEVQLRISFSFLIIPQNFHDSKI